MPPGYIQSLVKKITNNLSVVCNNLILKYVEDDIVLSINVRTVSSRSADHNWAPAFTGERDGWLMGGHSGCQETLIWCGEANNG